jgi:hypothetical protein
MSLLFAIDVADIMGAVVSGEVTTAIVVTFHELLVGTLEAFVMVPLNVSVNHNVAARGVIGICMVSVQSEAIAVVFVHVTVVQILAPQDHPFDTKELAGPLTFAGYVNTTVWSQLEAAFHEFVTVTGILEVELT